MNTYDKLRSKFNKEVKKLQSKCEHKKIETRVTKNLIFKECTTCKKVFYPYND